jgi:Cys-rich four helix bundle protein (predicted Tat secretion target)
MLEETTMKHGASFRAKSGNLSDVPIARRSLLAAGSGLAMVLAGSALARAEGEHDHHGDHSQGGSSHQVLIDAALTCVNRGDVCVNHCITLLGTGDTSLEDCLRSVSAMLPMCASLAKLASLDAKRLKDFAKVCIDVCADCEAECKKHAEHHAACKGCMESCGNCIKECKALA